MTRACGGGVCSWAMGAAVLYAVCEYMQNAFILSPHMLRLHGEVNALGFVLVNLLEWAVMTAPPGLTQAI